MKRISDWKEKCILLGILAAGVLAMCLLRLPCPWKAWLGIPCPGCGMTRAWVSALQLDFSQAFRLHPMFWSVPVMALWWLLDGHIFRKKFWNFLIPVAIGVGFAVNWLLALLQLYFY